MIYAKNRIDFNNLNSFYNMVLYVRKRVDGLVFVHSIDELRKFEGNYFPGTRVVLGDLSVFSRPMIEFMLKFLEENPVVDCFSSEDIDNPVLLSRFVRVDKTPLSLSPSPSLDQFTESDKSYRSVELYLDLPYRLKLMAVGADTLRMSLLYNCGKLRK